MSRFGKPGVVRGALAATVLLTSLSMVGCGQIARGDNPLGGNGNPDSKTSSQPSAGGKQPGEKPSKPAPPPDPYKLTSNIKDEASDVKIDKILKLTASNGTLSKVKVTGSVLDHGETKKVSLDGDLTDGKTGWTASELLEPSGDYTVKVSGINSDGKKESDTSTFSTKDVSLDNQVFPSFAGTMSGTVGVATPVVLQFDLPVKDKKTFEKHLHVSSSSDQKGSWHWYNDKEVHWRPAEYWEPGTKVTATADLNSVPAGDGLYGQKSVSTSFTVGDSVITKVNLKSHIAKVYVNSKLARTMKISAGKPGDDTRSGTSVITEKRTNYTMTSEMIGLPKTGPESYRLTAAYAMRITTSGEFLHSAPWNAGYFGRQNASHGCIGMSVEDSGWLYKHAKSGSPVIVTGSKRSLDPLNGLTDWNVDFETYAEGSAL
ncbi:L,D-transpeptidase [Microlunatus soli]|nr:Ig-like domain-containing protein [Microlunatus soli]